MKRLYLPVLASIAWLPVMFLASGPVVAWGINVCWLCAFITLAGCLTCIKAYRNPAIQADSNARISAGRLWLGIAVAVPVMLGCAGVALNALSAAREYAKSTITGANLRGRGQGIAQYVAQFGEAPDSFTPLIRSQICSAGSFWSFGDPYDPAYTESAGLTYSSFIYQPPPAAGLADPRIITAYERKPWTPLSFRLIPTYGRYVLFADGHVQSMDDQAFQAAQAEDAARRQELARPTKNP